MSVILEARDVSYRHGATILLDRISLTMRSGVFTVVIGPNGAGKSTLLRVLVGEMPPSTGDIILDGAALKTIPAWRLAHQRAVMPQGSEVAFPFSVLDVVHLGVEGLGRGLSGKDRRRLCLQALDQADVSHLRERRYQTLSGGERQRVHFARVLAQLAAGRTVASRQLLFLDEPIASLDLKHQLALLETARRLAQDDGLAVVAVLHDLQLAASAADEIVLMNNGCVVASGDPDAVLNPVSVAQVFGIHMRSDALPPLPWKNAV